MTESINTSADWPQDLLDIFEDPLFANVHPKAPKQTPEEVVREGFGMITAWSMRHDKRAPRMNRERRDEWLLAKRLKGIIDDDVRREMLRTEDKLHLLDTVYDE